MNMSPGPEGGGASVRWFAVRDLRVGLVAVYRNTSACCCCCCRPTSEELWVLQPIWENREQLIRNLTLRPPDTDLWPPAFDQFPFESEWMFVPSLEKIPPSLLEIWPSRERQCRLTTWKGETSCLRCCRRGDNKHSKVLMVVTKQLHRRPPKLNTSASISPEDVQVSSSDQAAAGLKGLFL